MSGANKHPYHLVEASPWPAVGAAAAFTAAVGGVMYMHEVAYGVAVLGLGLKLGVCGACAGRALSCDLAEHLLCLLGLGWAWAGQGLCLG